MIGSVYVCFHPTKYRNLSKYAFSDVAPRPPTVILWRKYVHANFGYVSKLTWRPTKFIFRFFLFKLSNSKRKGTSHLRSLGHLHAKFVLENGNREERNSPKTLCMCACVKSTRSWAVSWLPVRITSQENHIFPLPTILSIQCCLKLKDHNSQTQEYFYICLNP